MADKKRKLDMSRLRHRPVFLLDYERHDGDYTETDCKALSVGWAQYDPHRLSVKALRHTGSKWSRQSEEIPLHRAVDMVILLAHAMAANGQEEILLPEGTLERQAKAKKVQRTSEFAKHADIVRIMLRDPLITRRMRSLQRIMSLIDL